MRGRFFWRFAIFFAILSVLSLTGLGFLLWVAATRFEGGPLFYGPPFRPFGFLFFLILILGLIATGRALGRLALPVGDLMEAAGRVAEGNYSVRVIERGPPEVRSLARAFNQMTARLAADEEQRRTLLAEVTHELRTPLAVIQGNLEGLLDGIYPRDDAHLAPILDEARFLSTLIEDLRLLALAEAGALKLHREPTDLSSLIHETVASFRTQAENGGVTVTVEAPRDLPAFEIDPARIRQVLTNLLTNALQHAPQGGSIRIAAAREIGDGRDGTVAVSVSDTGRGIAPEDLPRIFDRFYKSRDSRGTGLGLAIVKNLVAAHGGEVSASSELGKGATIRFTLPVEQRTVAP